MVHARTLSLPLALGACTWGDRPADESPPDNDRDTHISPIDLPEDNVVNRLGDCEGRQRQPPAYPNQLGSGRELLKVTLTDPEAVCNDGTPAVLYVRRATDPDLERVWSIHLQGGGACGVWLTCAQRWCGIDYHDRSKMSSSNLPDTIDGFGIYDAGAANVLAGANQVFFYYCSSDSWGGVGSVRYEAPTEGIPEDLPIEGDLPDYTMFTRGHRIVEAGIEALERGVVGLDGEALPSLRDAERVVFSGTSGGSTGAARHADWLHARLTPRGTEVFAVFDAANGPAPEHFPEPYRTQWVDLSASLWDAKVATSDVLPFVDASCAAAHPGEDAWRCDQQGYLISHHVTTPFLARQDLRDLSSSAESIPTPESTWQEAVRTMLLGLADVPTEGLEGADVEVAPGAYGPNCAQHVALESTRWWIESTVRGPGGTPLSFQDAVLSWSLGTPVQVVDETSSGGDPGPRSSCATLDNDR